MEVVERLPVPPVTAAKLGLSHDVAMLGESTRGRGLCATSREAGPEQTSPRRPPARDGQAKQETHMGWESVLGQTLGKNDRKWQYWS